MTDQSPWIRNLERFETALADAQRAERAAIAAHHGELLGLTEDEAEAAWEASEEAELVRQTCYEELLGTRSPDLPALAQKMLAFWSMEHNEGRPVDPESIGRALSGGDGPARSAAICLQDIFRLAGAHRDLADVEPFDAGAALEALEKHEGVTMTRGGPSIYEAYLPKTGMPPVFAEWRALAPWQQRLVLKQVVAREDAPCTRDAACQLEVTH